MSQFEGFNNRYQAELREEIMTIERAILTGNAADFATYKNLVGKRLGFLQALERHQELLNLMKESE